MRPTIWKLFLDDVRKPPDDSWTLCTTVEDAKLKIHANGIPVEVSFDHDMGFVVNGEIVLGGICLAEPERDAPNGLEFAEFFVRRSRIEGLPEGFKYYIHSANHIGAKKIYEVMNEFSKQEPAGGHLWWKPDDLSRNKRWNQ